MRIILACAVLLPGVAIAQTVQPGLWETTSTTSISGIADLPPELAARMKGHTVTVRHCVTPQEAAKGPRQLISEQKSCAIDHYTMSGGRFDAKMTCSGMTITSSGRYTPTSMTGDSRMKGQDGMDASSHIESRRTGPC